MKKFYLLTLSVSTAIIFAQCSGSKKAIIAPPAAPVYTFTNHILPVMIEKCGPCHIPGKGNKLAMDNFDIVKSNIDDIIRRIELHPGERGYMPFKKSRLTDSTINLIKEWRTSGMAQ